ncbi:pimeloyl-ACP methyl ester carboxylesterase [Isoptericola jiangsuensis]|uniref:Pimeloyl-ACP methyl ester carboxylesterase n=1 Tax=Isoptericola jiangsuensis TaxID=548579 RepID=A0A2A9F0Y9_9MICO|nr:alpha/beta hydrolase [Isoptericola jiangsuensis]PFG44456.1 pimeloyl-ACP methyl ester carboxylesterase [Isoptericola jiangsuensis]
MSDASDYTSALVDGPWRHEFVPANGSRFHVATAGPDRTHGDDRPLVLLLHGYPQFWWTWRHQLAGLADSGVRVAAMDLRGTGASDKPPTGYDVPTRTRDVAGVVRSLGHEHAVVVGCGTGGILAWATAALQPGITAGVAALSAPHPLRLHVPPRRLLTPAARRLLALTLIPSWPERRLVDGRGVDAVLAAGGGPALPEDVLARYRDVLRIPFAAHSSTESVRWLTRTSVRPDGRRYLAALRRPVDVPVLQLHGAEDAFWRPESADVDGAALARRFRFEVVPDAGHLLPEQAPRQVTELLTDWLKPVLAGE